MKNKHKNAENTRTTNGNCQRTVLFSIDSSVYIHDYKVVFDSLNTLKSMLLIPAALRATFLVKLSCFEKNCLLDIPFKGVYSF